MSRTVPDSAPVLGVLLALALGAGLAASEPEGRTPGGQAKPALALPGIQEPERSFRPEDFGVKVGPMGTGRTGAFLGTGIVRGCRVGPGADLRRRNLRFANLSGYDLTDADFTGSDCTGALFRASILTGAKVQGTRLFGADIVGAKGLDLAGAELHPFFQAHAEPVGHFRFLAPELANAAEGPYSHLVATPGGHLLWLAGPDRTLQQMSPVGPTYTIQVIGCSPVALVRNAKDQLWVFGRETCSLLDLRQFETVPTGQPLKPVASVPSASAADPLAVTGGPGMSGWVSVPGTLHHYEPKVEAGTLTQSQCNIPSPTRPLPTDRTVPGRDGTTLFTFGPFRDGIMVSKWNTGKGTNIPLPAGCRAQGVAPGPDGGMWCTFTGAKEGVHGAIPMGGKAWRMVPVPLPGEEGRPRTPHDILWGPDGNLWVAERTGGRITRITPEGEPTEFPLPNGWQPLELFPGQGGRLYFTVAGMDLIGSIMAAPPEGKAAFTPEEKARAAESWAVTPPKPRPERTKAETQAQKYQRLQGYLERLQVHWPEPEEAPGAEETKAGSAEDLVPDAALESRNIVLMPWAVRHILGRHRAGPPTGTSQFSPEFSSRAALRRMITDGLEQAGRIGHVPSLDGLGRCVTYCRVAGPEPEGDGSPAWQEVGHTGQWRPKLPTDTFAVVTEPVGEGENAGHLVITAFPVRRRGGESDSGGRQPQAHGDPDPHRSEQGPLPY